MNSGWATWCCSNAACKCWNTGSAAQVSRGGRGCGTSISHISRPWCAGSAVSSRCSAVVPVRGSPVTKMGRSMRTVRVLRVRLPRGLAEQPGGERAAQHAPAHLPAQRGQVRVPGVGIEQHLEAVGVVVGAEVGQPGDPAGRHMQICDRADAVPLRPGQWWNSPQLTSRHWPVMARAIDGRQEHDRVGDLVRLGQPAQVGGGRGLRVHLIGASRRAARPGNRSTT